MKGKKNRVRVKEEGVEGKEGAQKEETERKFRFETLFSANKKEGL